MRRSMIALLAGVLLLGACGGDSGDMSGGEGTQVPTPSATEPGRDQEGGDTTVDTSFSDGRKVIRTARIELNAADTRQAYSRITTIVEGAGGFVARADVGRVDSEDAQPAISMTVRVPSDRLSEILSEIKAVADKVVTESQNSEDVSEQFVDLEARLTNLEALETELRALLEEVRSQPDADPEKLLRVFNELANVRGQIEQIEGQIQYLSGLTALATVEISLTQTPATAPIVDEPWAPAEAFRNAARSLVQAMQSVADGAITFFVFVLPVVLAVAIVPAAVGWWLWRRYRRRSAAMPPAAD